MHEITINAVDGVSTFSTKGTKEECLAFLKKYDHEGSNLSLDSNTTDSEKIYNILDKDAEIHRTGKISIENYEIIKDFNLTGAEADFGLQTSKDGRVWICINGISFIRFKPWLKGK